jgi:hypothetical protein
MPWKAFLQNGEYCVFKLDEAGEKTGSSLGCHPTRELANNQVAALNASEEKEENDMPDEIKEEKAHGVPLGITSFVDLDAFNEAQETAGAMQDATFAFSQLAENIMMSDEIEDKALALQALASEFAAKVADEAKEETTEEDGIVSRVVSKAKEVLGIKEKPKLDGGFYVWKEKDGYRWMSVYSNNIKDNDNPPDIISSKSHKRFVEMVDKGKASLPELWLWHVKEWKWGDATAVAYDDSGFAVAIGKVADNPAAIAVADWLKERDDILTSHGMPRPTVKREQDEKGNNVIVEHITREISPLFNFAAANKYTGFSILKENDMAIPKEKKEEFVEQGLAAEVLDQLEQQNAATDKETETLEKKEEEAVTEEATTQEAVSEPVTQEAVAGAIASVVKPLIEQVSVLTEQVKELTKTDAEKIAEKAATTPAASLEAMTFESIFGDLNKVDGRSTLAKSKPAEIEQMEEDWFIRPFLEGGK